MTSWHSHRPGPDLSRPYLIPQADPTQAGQYGAAVQLIQREASLGL